MQMFESGWAGLGLTRPGVRNSGLGYRTFGEGKGHFIRKGKIEGKIDPASAFLGLGSDKK